MCVRARARPRARMGLRERARVRVCSLRLSCRRRAVGSMGLPPARVTRSTPPPPPRSSPRHGLHPPPTQRTYGEHGPATHASRPWRRYPPSLPSTHPRAPAYTHARNAPLREANPSRRLRLTFRALEATRRFHARAAPGPAHRAAFAIGPPPPRPPIFAPVQGRRCQARRPDRVIGSARPTPARTSLPVRPAPARKSQN